MLIPIFENVLHVPGNDIITYYAAPINDQFVLVNESMNDQSNWMSYDWESLLFGVYFIGALLAAIKFGKSLSKICVLYKSAKVKLTKDYSVVYTNEYHLPFSFFNMLYWSEKYQVSELDKEQIIKHEEAHIKGRHSLDIMFLELLTILFWCSPLIYFYKKAIKTVHEYLADNTVLQTTSTKQYGHLLLSQSHTGTQMALGNHLIHSQLKNRIIMMTKNKSNQKNIIKYALVAPVLLLMFMAFSKKDLVANDLPVNDTEIINSSDQLDFDASEVVKSLTQIISQYSGDSNSDTKQKLSKVYVQKVNYYYSNYPKYKTLIFSIANSLIYENKVPWLLTKKPSRVDIKESTMEQIEKIIAENKKNYKGEFSEKYEGELFKMVEQMPRFPGCSESSEEEINECASNKMLTFIYENIKYPKEAQQAEIEGTVVVRFVVSNLGDILDAEVVRKIGGGCDEEALRVVESMPKWEPGKQNGKAVNVQYHLPIKYKLQGEKKEDEKKN